MLHVTCDICGKELRAGEDCHYVVKIESFAATDPDEITEVDLDEDHLEEISQLLRDLANNPDECDLAAPYQNFRYDLCSNCRERFLSDPLGRLQGQKLNFSKN